MRLCNVFAVRANGAERCLVSSDNELANSSGAVSFCCVLSDLGTSVNTQQWAQPVTAGLGCMALAAGNVKWRLWNSQVESWLWDGPRTSRPSHNHDSTWLLALWRLDPREKSNYSTCGYKHR